MYINYYIFVKILLIKIIHILFNNPQFLKNLEIKSDEKCSPSARMPFNVLFLKYLGLIRLYFAHSIMICVTVIGTRHASHIGAGS